MLAPTPRTPGSACRTDPGASGSRGPRGLRCLGERADCPSMWPFLPKPTVHGGVVSYRGPLAPRPDQILALADGAAGISATPADAAHARLAGPAVRLTHPVW